MLAVFVATGCTGPDLDGDRTPTPSSTHTGAAEATVTPSTTPTSTPPRTSTAEATQAAGIPTREPSSTPDSTTEGQEKVDVELTRYGIDNGVLSAGGVVLGVVDRSGTCTLRVSAKASAASATGPAERSAGTMACGSGLDIDLTGLEGKLTLVLSYESSEHIGTSAPVEVTR